MKKTVLHIVFLLFVALSFLSYSPKEDYKIIWSQDYKLTWDDFQGRVQSSNPNLAVSSTGVDLSYELKGNTLEVTISCFFNKKKSWAKEQKKSRNLLNHEQGHFDLTEIYARKIRQSLKEYKFKRKHIKVDIENIYKKTMAECWKEHDLYDKETNHSQMTSKQQEWGKKIDKMLEELEAYSETHLSIPVK